MSDKPALNLPPDQRIIGAKGFHPAGAFDEFSEKEVEQSIPDCFEKIVRKQPKRLAVAFEDLSLTYDDLNKAANRVAHALVSRRGAQREPAVLLLDQDIQYLIALLGLLKAGKFCVHVDPSNPAERQRAILRDAQAQLILTNTEYLSLGDAVAPLGSDLLNVEALRSDLPTENLELGLSPDPAANIFYTSGSTGSPKGVIQPLDTSYVSPRTPVEADLANIWAEVLGIDRVGIHDSFLDLGGHSLAATQVVSRVIKKFQLELPLRSLFQSPTVAEMAAVIAEHQGTKLDGRSLEHILSDLESLSEEEARRLLSEPK